MITKYLAPALLGTVLLSGTAFAQSSTAPAPTATSSAADSMTAPSNIKGTWRTSKLVGLNVYNSSNEKLGDINELLVDNSGKITAVIIGVGGFLGVGEQNVAVNFDQLKFANEPVRTSAASPSTNRAPTSSTVGSSSAINSGAMNGRTTHSEWYPDHAVISATKDQLKAMKAFKYSDYEK